MHGALLPRSSDTRNTFLYFGSLTLFIYLATPGSYLIDIQTAYLLKNRFRATATQISIFRIVTAIPIYFAFLAGLARDQWNPLGLKDRGFFLIFAPITAAIFVWMGLSSNLSYRGLLVGMLFAMTASRFVGAAYQGLMALIGQERLMSGRLSVLWNVVSSFPIIAGAVLSGFISDHLKPASTFFLVAAFTLCVALIGLWKPRAVFRHTYDAPQAAHGNFWSGVKRLAKHRAVYPAVLIYCLWNFAPGANTPLQFYLSDQLHASDAAFSYYNAIFAAAFLPTFLLYGSLCKRVALRKLLLWGTLVAVPQMVPLAFIHSASAALWLVVPTGLMGGVATAAYIDLAMRSCPPGLQGTLMMLVDGMAVVSSRGGDLLGSRIYNASPRNGFLYCVIAITIVYALILPLIFTVPKALIATADGEPSEDAAAPNAPDSQSQAVPIPA
jgi:hypothetical protein